MSFVIASIVLAVACMMAGSYMLSTTLDRVAAQYHISLGLMGSSPPWGPTRPDYISDDRAPERGSTTWASGWYWAPICSTSPR
jgi:hypothetical protein